MFKRFRTANSSFEAFGHEIEISVLGVVTYSMVYFFADPSIAKNVLGRVGWLDRVRLGLIDHDSEIYWLRTITNSHGRYRAPSCRSSHCFRSSPPAYPVNDAFAPITRWHGTMMPTGFSEFAIPAARTAFGLPT